MKCKVLLNNAACTVIDYAGKEVQIPPIGKEADEVLAEMKNGVCHIVEEKANKKAE